MDFDVVNFFLQGVRTFFQTKFCKMCGLYFSRCDSNAIIASPSTYPCHSVGSVIDSLEIAIASPSFLSLLILLNIYLQVCGLYENEWISLG